MCLKPSGWDLCVGSVGAHCSRSRGLGRYSTRSLSTLSLTPGAIPPRGVVVEGGCASPPPFFLSSLSLLVLYITFFFLSPSLFLCPLNSLVDWFSSRLMLQLPRWARAPYGKVWRSCTTVGDVMQSNPHHACNVSFRSRPLVHLYHLSTCLRPRASTIRFTAMCRGHVT
jgi:hypothetical protein